MGRPRDWNVDLVPKFLMANGTICGAILAVYTMWLSRATGEAADSQWRDPLFGIQVCGRQLCVQEGRENT